MQAVLRSVRLLHELRRLLLKTTVTRKYQSTPWIFTGIAAFALTAANSPDGARWWSYVEFLASDKLEGRNTGSEGHRKAAEYVASQFERDGLKPAGEQGYIQPVKFVTKELDETHSSLTLERNGKDQVLKLGEDAIIGTGADPVPSLEAGLVFVGYGLRMKRVAPAAIKERVGRALAMVRLHDLGTRAPRQLSGGQQQRVALARALVNEPQVLLLDEPLGALDLKLRRQMQGELTALNRELGITFIYVTHDQEEALTMSDRIALMRGGRIEQIGPPRELYDRPRSRYVADFIGETNLIPAGEGSWLSVRPEALAIAPDGRPGIVTAVVYAGSVVKTHVTLADGTEVVSQQAAHLATAAVGDAVRVRWPEDQAVAVRD